MASNYTTSINITRDTNRDFNYIPTPNSRQVISQIVNDFKKGIRSFNIIGTYGTGKSSFLLAFEQSVRGIKGYFKPNFLANSKIDFVKIVGSYSSIIEQFADLFEVSAQKYQQETILSEIFNRYHSIGTDKKILFIVIDEFGKFLEFASKNNPEKEVYFIQQLAEFSNNPDHNIVLITTVHQSLESYAYGLSRSQQQEWVKVKGRFREITFNEPVEQLLFLASEYLAVNFDIEISKDLLAKSIKAIIETKILNLNKESIESIAPKIYPLDLLSANILTLSLQRYGQNERSLFSFLESTDHTGLTKFNIVENPFFNIAKVYDYLVFNFYSFITSKFNPDFSSWASIRSSIEEVERSFNTNVKDYIKAIKVIGLLNIFSPSGSILDPNFLINYLNYACGLINPRDLIFNLEAKKIIRYRSHANRFILFQGTDLDIQSAIIEAGNKISDVVDVTTLLNKKINFAPVFAKQYSFTTGTPRYFEFIFSDYPIHRIPQGEVDGYINLVFNDKLKESDIQLRSKSQEEAIIYCFFENSKEIKNLLFEIEKIQTVIEDNKDDKVAIRELENIFESQIRLLNHYIIDNIYSGSNEVKWYFKGESKQIVNKKDFNKLVSQVCSIIYSETPVFKNEMVNKQKISTSIHTAKRNYFKALTNNWDKENLGFEDNKYPPEKTIYLSLLKENQISVNQNKSSNTLAVNKDSSFFKLWIASENFLFTAKNQQIKVAEFCSLLKKRPFKLKQGFIDFWVPTFLFLKRDEFAIFNDESYIPYLSEENLELIAKYPEKYFIKTFDIEGIKLDIFNSYRKMVNISPGVKFDNNSFIETIKPFIVFYKQLPEYTKKTYRLSKSAINIRNAIAISKDPEETFFEVFPNALGLTFSQLQEDTAKLQYYIASLQESVREIRSAYDELVKRFEVFICAEFVGRTCTFEEYKSYLQKRFSNLKKHLLLSNQRTFIQRLDSTLDDRKAWLNSIAQAVTGKSLDVLSDADEVVLYEKLKSMILELDSLTKISGLEIDETKEEIIGIKIDTFFDKLDQKMVRMPKYKTPEIEQLQNHLQSQLTDDRASNIAAVINLLKELLK